MSKFISKKPVSVEAIQFTGDAQAVIDFIDDRAVYCEQDRTALKIKFQSGLRFHILETGSYLVREQSGYMHPMQKEIFESTYVAAETTNSK